MPILISGTSPSIMSMSHWMSVIAPVLHISRLTTIYNRDGSHTGCRSYRRAGDGTWVYVLIVGPG